MGRDCSKASGNVYFEARKAAAEYDDRLYILVDNGYTVGTGKRQKTPNGKSVDYTLKLYADDGSAEK